jgi:hypothetical protein
MANTDPKDELIRVKVAFIINLMAALVTFLVLLNVIQTGAIWRIAFTAVGFAGITSFCVVIYNRLSKLQKADSRLS